MGSPDRPQVVRDGRAMIAGMTPLLDPQGYVMCSLEASRVTPGIAAAALALFREHEGTSLVLPRAEAEALGIPDVSAEMARITLGVHSSLEGVGLTAAVSAALAERDIPCNMIAAFHHDHVLVPRDKAHEAMDALTALQRAARA